MELLGTGSKQTLNVQSDINRLSQAQQDAVSKNVQKALLAVTASHAPPSASTTTTTNDRHRPPSDHHHDGQGGGRGRGDHDHHHRAGQRRAQDAWPTRSASPRSARPGAPPSPNKAIEALIIFFIVVAIYISIRFEPKMALAAFIAMIHDVLVAIGIYSIFNFQVTPDTVVAILTILGYSLYDTVVVFDRVRDNTKGIGSSGRMTYPQLINLSMNQTLARSINTSMVAILPVLAVLLIGAQLLGATTLQSYGLALFVGLLSGAYSSIFIAAPVLSMMKEREERWVSIANRLAKRGETQQWYSAVDAATMSTQMSVAASGQVSRGGAAAAAARRRRPPDAAVQAQRPDPAGLGQPAGWRCGEGRWRRGHRDGGDGPARGGSSGSRAQPAPPAGGPTHGPGAEAPQDQARQAPALTPPRAPRMASGRIPGRLACMDGDPGPGDCGRDETLREPSRKRSGRCASCWPRCSPSSHGTGPRTTPR